MEEKGKCIGTHPGSKSTSQHRSMRGYAKHHGDRRRLALASWSRALGRRCSTRLNWKLGRLSEMFTRMKGGKLVLVQCGDKIEFPRATKNSLGDLSDDLHPSKSLFHGRFQYSQSAQQCGIQKPACILLECLDHSMYIFHAYSMLPLVC